MPVGNSLLYVFPLSPFSALMALSMLKSLIFCVAGWVCHLSPVNVTLFQ